jgi:hypothetical protein
MTLSDTQARANSQGQPCPAWCATGHGELLIPGKPQFGYVDGHYSDPMGAELPMVKLTAGPWGDAEPEVLLQDAYGLTSLQLGTAAAGKLAVLLAASHGGADRLSVELRMAVTIARETR